MHTKPELIEVRALRNEWSREAHYARVLPALGTIIDVTPTPRVVPGVIARQPRTPERVNRRVTKPQLIAHQVTRALLVDLRTERLALAAANEALEPLSRTWWARLSRAVRSLVGR
jgi:hypothetical protein